MRASVAQAFVDWRAIIKVGDFNGLPLSLMRLSAVWRRAKRVAPWLCNMVYVSSTVVHYIF